MKVTAYQDDNGNLHKSQEICDKVNKSIKEKKRERRLDMLLGPLVTDYFSSSRPTHQSVRSFIINNFDEISKIIDDYDNQ